MTCHNTKRGPDAHALALCAILIAMCLVCLWGGYVYGKAHAPQPVQTACPAAEPTITLEYERESTCKGAK